MDRTLFELQKALDTTATNNNNVLDPVLLSKTISNQVRRFPVLRNMISRIDWPSNVYEWDSAVSEGVAQTYTDGATLAFSDAAWAQGLSKMSYYSYLMAISNPAIRATQTLIDVVAERLGQATRAILRLEGQAIFSGDPLNGTNPGLNSVLAASPTQSFISTGVFGQQLLEGIDAAMITNGFRANVIVLTPNCFAYLKAAAYNKVRFVDETGPVKIGFSPNPSDMALMFNGLPVIADPYAISYQVATNSQMVSATGHGANTYAFANSNVQKAAGTNFVGTSWAAPVISVNSATVPASAYVVNQDGSYTFTSTPAATPTATYTYGQDNVYFLSLDPADLVIAENLGLMVEQDLGKPAQYDGIYLRAKEYCTTIVRNPLAHVAALNVTVPALGAITGIASF